jgi:Tol biopolymer transport system component
MRVFTAALALIGVMLVLSAGGTARVKSVAGSRISSASSRTTPSSTGRILFTSNRSGRWTLYSMNPDGGDQSRLSRMLGYVDPADPAGDGLVMNTGTERVLFRREDFSIDSQYPARISSVNPRSGAWSTTVDTVDFPVFSPDGKEEAYSQRSSTSGARTLSIMGADKSVRHLAAAHDGTPVAWSPDGKWILYTRGVDNSGQWGTGRLTPTELDRIRQDGSQGRMLTQYAPMGGIRWLSDHTVEYAAAQTTETGSQGALVVVDVATGQVDVLKKLPAPAYSAWSPGGQTLVYVVAQKGNVYPAKYALYATSADGSVRRRLTPEGFSDTAPAWSPDGTQLLFVRSANGGFDNGAKEIWVMSADGSGQRQLTQPYPDGGENAEPVWIHGPVARTAAPASHATRRLLRPAGGVQALGAYGNRAVVTLFTGYPALYTPPLVVWQPGKKPTSISGSLCGGYPQAVVAGNRVALHCADGPQPILVFDLRTGAPVHAAAGDATGFTRNSRRTFIDGPVFSNGHVEFESSHTAAGWHGGKVVSSTLWEVDGARLRKLATSHGMGRLVTADATRLVFKLSNTEFAITTSAGERLGLVHLPHAAPVANGYARPQFGLDGNHLIRMADEQLTEADIRTGKLERIVHLAGDWEFGGASGGIVAYSTGGGFRDQQVHILSGKGQRVIRLVTNQNTVHVALTSAGLFYGFNVPHGHGVKGHVVFIPRSRLLR